MYGLVRGHGLHSRVLTDYPVINLVNTRFLRDTYIQNIPSHMQLKVKDLLDNQDVRVELVVVKTQDRDLYDVTMGAG